MPGAPDMGGMGAPDAGGSLGTVPAPDMQSGDNFGATDAAAGGPDVLGREKR
jgi:hypothetical protein